MMSYFIPFFFCALSLSHCGGREVSAFLNPSVPSSSSTSTTTKKNIILLPAPREAYSTFSLILSSTKTNNSAVKVKVETQQRDDNNAAIQKYVTQTADDLFDSIDTNNDGGISDSELRSYLKKVGYSSESIRYLFTALDKNADGKVSREELRYAFSNYEMSALYSAFGLDRKEKKDKVSPNSVSKKAAARDRNRYKKVVDEIRNDAKLDKSNLLGLNILADLIFSEIDTDNNGVIDKEELRQFLCEKKAQADGDNFPLKIQEIFTALDVDGDGTISQQEMRDGFKQYDHRALSSAFGFAVAKRSEV